MAIFTRPTDQSRYHAVHGRWPAAGDDETWIFQGPHGGRFIYTGTFYRAKRALCRAWVVGEADGLWTLLP